MIFLENAFPQKFIFPLCSSQLTDGGDVSDFSK